MVVSAPTGAGKTAIFELAIIRHLMKIRDSTTTMNTKVVYSTYMKLSVSLLNYTREPLKIKEIDKAGNKLPK